MVFQRIELHPATTCAPAIFVEDEACDACGDMDRDRKALGQYNVGLETNTHFNSKVIGTTVRPSGFLRVPGEVEDSCEDLSCDCEVDLPSLYDEILAMNSGFDLCSPFDGVVATDTQWGLSHDGIATCNSGLGPFGSPCDGIPSRNPEFDVACSHYLVTPPMSVSRTRREGMVDMASFAQRLRDMIPEDGYALRPTTTRQTGLCDLSGVVERDPTWPCGLLEQLGRMDGSLTTSDRDIDVHDGLADCSGDTEVDSTLSWGPLEWLGPVDNILTTLNGGIGVHNGRDDFANTATSLHNGLDPVQRLLEELRDPNLDCVPWPLPEDSDSEYGGGNSVEAGDPRLMVGWSLHRRDSLDSTSSSRTERDVSGDGPMYPLTPPSQPASSPVSAHDIGEVPMSPSLMVRSNGEVLSLASPYSPPSLPVKAFVRSYRDGRASLYGPRVPLTSLPRL